MFLIARVVGLENHDIAIDSTGLLAAVAAALPLRLHRRLTLSAPRRQQRARLTEAHYADLLKDDLVAARQQVPIPVAPRGEGNAVRMPRRGRLRPA